jgi:hypothetical protein
VLSIYVAPRWIYAIAILFEDNYTMLRVSLERQAASGMRVNMGYEARAL